MDNEEVFKVLKDKGAMLNDFDKKGEVFFKIE